MTVITDEFMLAMMPKAKTYCAVILKAGPQKDHPDREQIVWEHGRRNFVLRADGILSIVCPIRDASDVSGIGIFNGTMEEIRQVMDADPGVKAGVFTYELHACRGFPGDCLPG